MKDVVGYEDRFSITEAGKLWSKRTNKFLSQTVNNEYYTHCTKIGGRNGVAKLLRIHRCVAEAYIPNPENKRFVNHIDGNKLNNHVDNLEWCTPSENIRYAYATGLQSAKTGFDNASSRLTPEMVEYIRLNCIPYSRTHGTRALGRLLGISHVLVQAVYNQSRHY